MRRKNRDKPRSVQCGTDSTGPRAYTCDGRNQNPSVRVGIDGSTDLLRGANQYNAALSQQRVSNVREALIRGGVAADRIETGGFGVERAKCNDANELCGQRDGRVEVMVRPAS